MFESDVKLVVFHAPAPVNVAHSIDGCKVFGSEDENPPDEWGIVVFWVEVGHVHGHTLSRKSVGESGVEGEEVNVMHGHVVEILAGQSEAHIYQRCSIETESVHLQFAEKVGQLAIHTNYLSRAVINR